MLQALHGSGVRWAAEIPAWLSVLVIAAVLLATVLAGTGSQQAPLARRGAVGAGASLRRHRRQRERGLGAGDYQLAARRLCEAFGYAADSAAGACGGHGPGRLVRQRCSRTWTPTATA